MEFQDITLQCVDCKQSFTFTAGEQQFYDRKGFKETPKRCRTCRDARKQRRDTGPGAPDAGASFEAVGNTRSYGGPRGSYNSGGNVDGNSRSYGNGARPQREMFDATCVACGAQTRVPFRPAPGRPVYCRECFGNRAGA